MLNVFCIIFSVLSLKPKNTLLGSFNTWLNKALCLICALENANDIIYEFIVQSFTEGVQKLIVVTGKGLHSENEKNPYVSRDLSILKYSVPDFIKKNKKLMGMIYDISEAKIEDGGSGAFYVYLKKNKNI